MKKMYVLLFACSAWFFFFAQEAVVPPLKSKSDIFKEDCQKYHVEPGWVISDFLKMDVQEFDVSWNYLVEYLKNNPEFIEKKRRVEVSGNCFHYDQFLSNLYVTQDNTLILKNNDQVPAKALSIFNYWKTKKNTEYIHFYAFYFDRMAAEFVEAAMNVALQESNQLAALQASVKGLLLYLKYLFKRLKNSEYDARYAYHVKRYQEIKDLLCKEATS